MDFGWVKGFVFKNWITKGNSQLSGLVIDKSAVTQQPIHSMVQQTLGM
jgi:hypothetical protein